MNTPSPPPPQQHVPRSFWLVRRFRNFIALEASGGLLLMGCAVIALIWANTPWAASYFGLWGTIMTYSFGGLTISKPLLLWINDGLMAIFFFVVGLEIKREVLVGELAAPRKAALALAGALGGMVVPAGLYLLVAGGTDAASGWGIPMATDIAFALGVLLLMGRRAPLALKIFLTALAIVDDLGAVLVIALFYTAEISWGSLLLGFALLAVLAGLNRAGVRRTWPYVVIGLVIWVAFLKSGVHATIAGVLLALTIPARHLIHEGHFYERARHLLDEFGKGIDPGNTNPDEAQRQVLHELDSSLRAVDTPLHRMEHALHPWTAFFILPVFALANAGVGLGSGFAEALASPVSLGILLGLIVGKPLGVMFFAWLAVRVGMASLPTGITWRQMFGVSCLTGIGFTMSLFIANLAFTSALLIDQAKIGILLASVCAGLLGWFFLSSASKANPTTSASAEL